MKQQVLQRWLLVIAIGTGAAASGCGGGGGGGAVGGSGSGNSGGSGTGTGNSGGAPKMCTWVVSNWVCSTPTGAGGSGGPSGSGVAGPASGSGGAAMDAGGGSGPSGDGGAPPSGVAPSITIAEFATPNNPKPNHPGAITLGKDGNVWYNHQSTGPPKNAASKMTAAGMFTRVDLPQTNIGPVGIAAGPDGNIWYTGDLRVGQIQLSGSYREFSVPGGHDSAAITGGPENKVWFTQPIAGQIASVTTAGMFTEFKIPTANAGPFGITAGPDGNLWFTEQNASSNKIGRMTPAGVFTEWPVPTPAASPYCITAGPDGNLWFTERDGHRIGRITPAGVVTEFVIPSGASPGPIVAGADGNLWFAETKAADALGRITPSGFIAEYALPTPNSDSMGLTAGPDATLFFTEQENNKIAKITNLMGGGNVAPGLKPVPSGGTPTPCTNDTDCGGCWCIDNGATCDATTHHCSITSIGRPAPLPDGGAGH